MNPLNALSNTINNTIKSQVKKTANKRLTQVLTVLSTEQISENLKRIVFEDESQELNTENESGYLKLQFERDGKVVLRSYTILLVEDNKITIDFVTHDGGFGSEWAKTAQVGDTLMRTGLGPAKIVDTSFDWYILIGDLTALPAITVNLKKLPKDAKGYVIIEVLDESDMLDLQKPEGLHVEWIVNVDIDNSPQLMLSAIESKEWLAGTPYVWVASEFDSARALRQFFKKEKGIKKNQFYYSSYWKRGVSDEGNKKAKKVDGGF